MKKLDKNTELELDTIQSNYADKTVSDTSFGANLKYVFAGAIFGIILIKAEVMSWFRIQEMFRLQAFHMYGVIGTAVVVGMISVQLIKLLKIKTLDGKEPYFVPKPKSKGHIYGGIIFGLGWAITGACPGPIYAQIGAGFGVVFITLLSAIAGTWFYGSIREKLPH